MREFQPAPLTNKITEQERRMVDLVGNLSDAQVYLPLTEAQRAAIPSTAFMAEPRCSFDIDTEKTAFLESFSGFHGGLSMPLREEVLFGYSASMAIEIVANALRIAGMRKVGLIHPTYDATFHILRRHNAQLCPIPEARLSGDPTRLGTWLASLDALMLTLPNNPTGWTLHAEEFCALAQAARETGTFLIIDCCFRAYAAQVVDHYKILAEAGADCALIEDTGKLFNIKDIKLGMLWTRGRLAEILWDIHRDYLLEVPLFNLVALRQLLDADGPAHARHLRATVARNRRAAHDALAPLGLAPMGVADSNVQLFRLSAAMTAGPLQAAANAEGVGIVAANAYFWINDAPGEFIRLALARMPDEFDRHIRRLRAIVTRCSDAQ